jgi:hypothetical protein
LIEEEKGITSMEVKSKFVEEGNMRTIIETLENIYCKNKGFAIK